jgi:hypothetical protein
VPGAHRDLGILLVVAKLENSLIMEYYLKQLGRFCLSDGE